MGVFAHFQNIEEDIIWFQRLCGKLWITPNIKGDKWIFFSFKKNMRCIIWLD